MKDKNKDGLQRELHDAAGDERMSMEEILSEKNEGMSEEMSDDLTSVRDAFEGDGLDIPARLSEDSVRAMLEAADAATEAADRTTTTVASEVAAVTDEASSEAADRAPAVAASEATAVTDETTPKAATAATETSAPQLQIVDSPIGDASERTPMGNEKAVAPDTLSASATVPDAVSTVPTETISSAQAGADASGSSQIPAKKPKLRWRRPLLAIASCALVAIALIPILQQVLPGGEDPQTRTAAALPADENGLYQFTSYEELDDQINSLVPEEHTGGGILYSLKSADGDVAMEESIDMAAEDSATADADMASGSGGSAADGFASANGDGDISTKGSAKGADGSSAGEGSAFGPSEGSADGRGAAEDTQHSNTYTQVEGIDEADIVKTDGKYIYYVSSMENQIIIAKASKGKARRVSAVGGSSEGSYINDIYINKDQLIVIGEKDGSTDDATAFRKGTWTSNTVVTVYDISDRAKPQRTNEYTQSGYVLSSRLIGDRLLLVTKDSITTFVKKRSLPFVSYDGDSMKKLPITDIACFPQVTDAAYTVMGLMDLTAGKTSQDSVKTKAILGGSDEIYCSGETLYVTGTINTAASKPVGKSGSSGSGAASASGSKDGLSGSASDAASAEDIEAGNVPTISTGGQTYAWPDGWHWETQILKVSLADGKVKYQRSAIVDGKVKNQWAMDERDGTFRVATTADHDGADVNDLFLLDENMKQVGSVIGFAKDEHIEAVRYIGKKAYVITYEQTDPLFIIDLSDARSPIIEGHVKISGFSTLLVPTDASHLLGLGFDTETTEFGEATDGLKLALFDISDPAQPKVADEEAYPYAYSQVQYDHKALLAGPGGNYYAVPYDYEYWDDGWDDTEDVAGYDEDGDPVIIEDAEEAEGDADDADSSGDSATSSDAAAANAGGTGDADSTDDADGSVTPLPIPGTHEHGILVFSTKAGKLQILDDLECAESVSRCIYIGDYIYGICNDDSIEGFKVN